MISRTLLRMDNRYPKAKERSDLLTYVSSAGGRRIALEEVRRKTGVAIDEVMSEVRKMYPQFGQYRPRGFDKGHSDMCLLTAMTANAMFLGETDTVDDQFVYWYQSILKSVHLSPQFLADSFRLWKEALRRHLTSDSFKLMEPFVQHMIAVLSDIPDPAKDEVGERLSGTPNPGK